MLNIYADNAATTPISPEVKRAMIETMQYFGNPSSSHFCGAESKVLIETARISVADAIGANESEIYFTSGGSESNNWAIRGFAEANKHKGNHIITSTIEHPSVLNTMKYLESIGFEVSYIGVDSSGVINIKELYSSIREDTILISVMFANNEIGTIQPINTISRIANQKNICFHTDATQAIGNVHINVKELNINMLSLSGHKFNGPKGVGALYIEKVIKVKPLIYGGHQESGIRAGTENTISIVGMGSAINSAISQINFNKRDLSEIRDKFVDGIIKSVPDVKFNAGGVGQLNGIISVSFKDIESESLVTLLSARGIYVSSGSACSTGDLEVSHVIKSIGVPDDYARGTVRFSFGKYTTFEEVDKIIDVSSKLIKELRT